MRKHRKTENKKDLAKAAVKPGKAHKAGKRSNTLRTLICIGIAVSVLAIALFAILYNNGYIGREDEIIKSAWTATGSDGISDTAEVVAKETGNTGNAKETPGDRWRAGKSTLVIRSGESDTISCTRNGEEAHVKWYSGDDSIAHADEDGVVYAIASGSTFVNAVYDGDTVLSVPVHVDREALPPLKKPEPSRFTLHGDVYTNPDATATNEATLMFVGDLMCVSEMQRQAMRDGTYDFNAGFDYIKPVLEKADLAVGNLETVLSHSAPYKHEQVRVMGAEKLQHNCNAPSTFLDAVRHAGFDAVVTAHNHSLDAGIQGIRETLGHLSNYNIPNTGSFIERDERRFMLFNLNGINIAILSYATSFNTFDRLHTEEELEAHVNLYSKEKARRDISAARGTGAEYVFVYMHWGSQNSAEVTDRQLAYGQELADAGADYILGNHPHVLNRFDYIISDDGRNVPVIYSLGNFFTDMNEVENLNSDSMILKISLAKDDNGVKLVGNGYIPCFILIDYDGLRNLTVPCDIDTNDVVTSKRLKQARERISAALGDKIDEITP